MRVVPLHRPSVAERAADNAVAEHMSSPDEEQLADLSSMLPAEALLRAGHVDSYASQGAPELMLTQQVFRRNAEGTSRERDRAEMMQEKFLRGRILTPEVRVRPAMT